MFYDHTDYYNYADYAGYSMTAHDDRYGANAGWEWTPVDGLTANAAARWEDYGAFGRHTTWRLGFGMDGA